MSDVSAFRCGRVAVVGRPNAGKSTLVNRLVGRKVAIVSAVPQTTRNVILGVRNEPGCQLIFIDTPGVHLPKHELNRRMVAEAYAAMEGVDAIVAVIDASARMGRGDRFVIERVQATGIPFVLLLNKADRVKPKERLLPVIAELAAGPAVAVVPASALHGQGLDGLLTELRALVPEGPAQLPLDLATDQTERFMIAELIREKVLDATREEVPHATTVLVDALRETEGAGERPRLVVDASLVVEKENQKAILIGRGGQMLKRIGTAARLDVEEQLGVSCRLNLFVKVVRKWREDRAVLAQVFEGSRGVVPGRPSAEELLAQLSDVPPPEDDE